MHTQIETSQGRWYNDVCRAAVVSGRVRRSITGGELVSTGVVKQLGACRGVGPRKTLTIANLTANDETYALAA